MHTTKMFYQACRRDGVNPSELLQYFVDVVSVDRFLFPGKDPLVRLASGVFSEFIKSYTPDYPLLPTNREIAITGILRILEIMQEPGRGEARAAACSGVIREWYEALHLQQAGSLLLLDKGLAVRLTKAYLVQCEVYRCLPERPLHYLVQEIAGDTASPSSPTAATLFYRHHVAVAGMAG